ncbi:MAG: hypothetical protein QE278_01880 [Limnobacter sp.]|nr:hypothetical protein [Limnobacter sp.]
MPSTISPMPTSPQASNDIESQIIQSGVADQAAKQAQNGDSANRALHCCTYATACAANLAMLYLGKVLTQYQIANTVGGNSQDACAIAHPELANPVPTGVVLCTAAFAGILALPSVMGLLRSVANRIPA